MYQLEPGSEFAGFTIEGVIGTGGMSVLYRARDPHLQRVVALKIMSAALSEDDDFRRRFTEEARLAAAIDHPNVVPIYGFGQVGESLYIAMRYVPGTDLRKLLRAEHALTPQRTSDLLGQVAAALDVVHRRGMVHRDVKPDNVLITPPTAADDTEYAYLADFGLTRSDTQSRITQAGQIVGTLAYAAPEQLRGEEVSASADVYSLGCVLYECLVGDRPFRRNNDASVIYAHLHDPPPKVSEVRPDLPPLLDDVIAAALAKDPAHRYASAGDLLRGFRYAMGLHDGPATSEISLDAIARAGDVGAPPVEVWAGVAEPDLADDHAADASDTDAVGDHATRDSRPAPARRDPAAPANRRNLLIGVLGVVVLAVVIGVVAATRTPTGGDGRDGSAASTTEVEAASFLGEPKSIDEDDSVQVTRSLQFADTRRDRVTVQLTVFNRSSNGVHVELVDVPPSSLASNGASIETTTPTSESTSGTAYPGAGTTIAGVNVPFSATIARGAQISFAYTVTLAAPADGTAIQRWGATFPTPIATVTGLI